MPAGPLFTRSATLSAPYATASSAFGWRVGACWSAAWRGSRGQGQEQQAAPAAVGVVAVAAAGGGARARWWSRAWSCTLWRGLRARAAWPVPATRWVSGRSSTKGLCVCCKSVAQSRSVVLFRAAFKRPPYGECEGMCCSAPAGDVPRRHPRAGGYGRAETGGRGGTCMLWYGIRNDASVRYCCRVPDAWMSPLSRATGRPKHRKPVSLSAAKPCTFQ